MSQKAIQGVFRWLLQENVVIKHDGRYVQLQWWWKLEEGDVSVAKIIFLFVHMTVCEQLTIFMSSTKYHFLRHIIASVINGQIMSWSIITETLTNYLTPHNWGYLFSVKRWRRKQRVGKNGMMMHWRDVSPIGRDRKICLGQKSR